MAITTDVGVCNLALSRIGVTTTITTLADATKEARACNQVYDLVLYSLLRAAPWHFSTLLAVLAEDTSASGHDPNYSYAYTLPTNHLKTWGIEPLRGLSATQRQEWKHGYDDTGAIKVLYCNVTPESGVAPVLKYTTSNRTTVAVTAMSAEFIDALAWAVAAELAFALRADPKLAQLIPLRAKYALEAAIAAEFGEQQSEPEPDASYIAARD